MSKEAVRWALASAKARSGRLLVLMTIAEHADARGRSWPGLDTIAAECNYDRKHVCRCIIALVESGELLVETRSEGRVKTVYVVPFNCDIRASVSASPTVTSTPRIRRKRTVTQETQTEADATASTEADRTQLTSGLNVTVDENANCDIFVDPTVTISGGIIGGSLQSQAPYAPEPLSEEPYDPKGSAQSAAPVVGEELQEKNPSAPIMGDQNEDLAEGADKPPIGVEANAAYQDRYKARYGKYRKLLDEDTRTLKTLRKHKSDFYQAIDSYFASEHPFVIKCMHSVGTLKAGWGDIWLAEDPVAAAVRRWPLRASELPKSDGSAPPIETEDARKWKQKADAAKEREQEERRRIDLEISRLPAEDRSALDGDTNAVFGLRHPGKSKSGPAWEALRRKIYQDAKGST